MHLRAGRKDNRAGGAGQVPALPHARPRPAGAGSTVPPHAPTNTKPRAPLLHGARGSGRKTIEGVATEKAATIRVDFRRGCLLRVPRLLVAPERR